MLQGWCGLNGTCQGMINDPLCPSIPDAVSQHGVINLHRGPVRPGQNTAERLRDQDTITSASACGGGREREEDTEREREREGERRRGKENKEANRRET